MSFLREVEHLQIPLSEILSATHNFAKNNFIELRGYGMVYQGQSQQYGTIDVKRLMYHGSQQEQHEFMMEIALLSAYKHENLVSLVGFCDQDGEKILVFKHESNGSLDKVLQSKDLNWIQRLRICIDAAKGLKYLHDDVGPQHRVLHRDVKSSNILLDENWKAKISDFGLSKISPANVPFTFLISKAWGTIGYVDPEYVHTGVLTKESDVYSFGVVLFEVLCGRLALAEYQDERRFLFVLAKNHYEKEKLEEIIDSDLQKQMNSTSLSTFSTIAYQCLKESREYRPTMRQIVEELEKALDYQLLASSGLQQEVSVNVDAALHLRLSRLTTSSSLSSHSTRVSSSRLWNHDVFVSFRGIDVAETFVDHIYSTLVQKGIHTYMDDDTFHWGESIPPSHFKVIRESQIVVIIFSPNYAKSSWCLNELAYVMESKDEIGLGQIVMPVFYGVEPSDVRYQQGEFGKAIAIHESNIKADQSWKKALLDVTNLSSWTENDVVNGTKFIKSIVDTISRRLLPSTSSDNTCRIGINTRIQDLKSQLQVGFGGVHMVGITGTWGSGKSTLASSIYGELRHEFDGCCFVKNVRAESRMYGLKKLQEKILSKVLKLRKVVLGSIEEGISMMISRLSCTSVLIVLDDVDHLDQLKMLARSQDWFGKGSRIIIVTRNKDLLNAHKINIIYDVRLLNDEEAIELFSMHAFGACRPVEGYEKLSLNMVSKFGGHPSSLISLGSFLHDKDMSEWMRTSAKLDDIPDDEIMELFKIGDDGVQNNIYSWLGY